MVLQTNLLRLGGINQCTEQETVVFKPEYTHQAKPFLKWAGGKSRVVSQLLELFPASFNSYYEPFLGSGALYFAIAPQYGRLNDANTTLISTYQTLRDDPDSLIIELDNLQTDYRGQNTVDQKRIYYLARRKEFNSLTDSSVRKSALFIFLNKTGFNGMYRENNLGEYNIPFGKHKNPTILDESNLRKISSVLQNIEITHGSYKDALVGASSGDLVYLDPPYYPLSSTSNFTQYQAGGFSIEEQVELRDLFKKLDQQGCLVMMSNSACEEIEKLYADFNIYPIKVARAINSKGGKRGKIDEYVITNYRPLKIATNI